MVVAGICLGGFTLAAEPSTGTRQLRFSDAAVDAETGDFSGTTVELTVRGEKATGKLFVFEGSPETTPVDLRGVVKGNYVDMHGKNGEWTVSLVGRLVSREFRGKYSFRARAQVNTTAIQLPERPIAPNISLQRMSLRSTADAESLGRCAEVISTRRAGPQTMTASTSRRNDATGTKCSWRSRP
jgi:hypothetical protein